MKGLALLVGSYLLSTFLAVVALFGTLGLTSRWGAARAGEAMMTMLAVDLGLYVLFGVVLGLSSRRVVAGTGGRVALGVTYAVLSLVTLGLLAFTSVIAFNR